MSPSLQVTVSLEEPSPSEQDDRPEKPVCKLCASAEITFDATAWWDNQSQSFEYDIADGDAFCLYCDDKQPVKWVPV